MSAADRQVTQITPLARAEQPVRAEQLQRETGHRKQRQVPPRVRRAARCAGGRPEQCPGQPRLPVGGAANSHTPAVRKASASGRTRCVRHEPAPAAHDAIQDRSIGPVLVAEREHEPVEPQRQQRERQHLRCPGGHEDDPEPGQQQRDENRQVISAAAGRIPSAREETPGTPQPSPRMRTRQGIRGRAACSLPPQGDRDASGDVGRNEDRQLRHARLLRRRCPRALAAGLHRGGRTRRPLWAGPHSRGRPAPTLRPSPGPRQPAARPARPPRSAGRRAGKPGRRATVRRA